MRHILTAGQNLSASSSPELLLLLQASSITDALLMSPRSMSSTNTKGPPATPGALGGAPFTCPSHDSPALPCPLLPLSPAASAESAGREAPVGDLMSHDRMAGLAGPGRILNARLRPDIMQSGEMADDRKLQYNLLYSTVALGYSSLPGCSTNLCRAVVSMQRRSKSTSSLTTTPMVNASVLQGNNRNAKVCTASQRHTHQGVLRMPSRLELGLLWQRSQVQLESLHCFLSIYNYSLLGKQREKRLPLLWTQQEPLCPFTVSGLYRDQTFM